MKGLPKRYQVNRELGHGAFGAVYEAWDSHLRRLIALKVLHQGMATDPKHRARFVREARVASGLSHPNIVTIYELHVERQHLFIAMEYIFGETLLSLLSRSRIARSWAMTIATQVGTAIEFAHRHGVIHRDIKPANILIAGDEGVAKVVDFGLAALSEKSIQPDFLSSVGNAAHTGVGYCVGTPAYMSPEQALGQRSDTRSDIFSFGILLYELFTGTQPFYGDNLASLFYQIVNRPVEPPSKTDITLKAVDDIVMGCLEKEPTRRWQNMEYVVEQLKSITPEFQSTRWLKPAAQVGAGTNHVPESEGIKAPGRLRIDDVHVEEEKHIKTCLIDFRVSNGGGSDVVINRIRFTAVNVASVPVAGLMELTETYSLDISQLEKAGDIAEIPVAQIVPPGRSDRFGVRLTAVHVTAGGVFRGWNLRPTLVSNFGPVEGPVVEIWLPYRYGKYTVATAKEIEELYEAMRSAHQAGDREEFRRLEHAQRLLLGLEKKQ